MSWRAFQRFGVVAAAALVAAALRFWPLDGRSYWRDEAFTVDLVRLPFAEMLDEILAIGGDASWLLRRRLGVGTIIWLE